MKKIGLLLMVVCLIAGLSTIAFAANDTQKLDIKSLKVYVDGKSTTVDDGDTISKEASPGSKVEFKVELENQYTNEQDLNIEDITVTTTIVEIDDGEDIDSDADITDIKPEKDKTVTLTFDIPYLVDQDTYDVDIEVEGDDENGTDQSFIWTVYLEVKKEKHNVIFTKAGLENEGLKCGDLANLDVALLNVGEEDEDVKLEIKNKDLAIDIKDSFSLDGDTIDDEAKYSKSFEITIPKNAKKGDYPVPLKATYNEGSNTETKTVTLSLGDCIVEPIIISGCTNETALNYNPDATREDGSCEYEEEIVGEDATDVPEAVPVSEGTVAPFSIEGIAVISLIILGAVLVIVLVIFLVVRAARRP